MFFLEEIKGEFPFLFFGRKGEGRRDLINLVRLKGKERKKCQDIISGAK